ncbi:response regulator transcription factor [Arsenicicoccus sp. oral taxon 190]|uniref:response regulator transcription factor n=1 Tax=Arsenicicoccus sp. oral taxon 190 TaxID=1658671 RepID=UPI000679EB64|nr:response regulator [Arsenicicoccus sp. oral taxon 190]AKT52378.1 histidine kinase [Arsenicicoccus sp. oral taxon 190]
MTADVRIVVADDDADIRDLVTFKLGQAGHAVTAVGDGAAALEAIRTEHPDLAVLDVMMPGLSGVDVLREVRADPTLADVAIILLTARSRDTDVDEGFAAGADDYVVKPFSPRELGHRVSSVLQRRARQGVR